MLAGNLMTEKPGKKKKAIRKLFTTGEVAEMIGGTISPRTVAGWIDHGFVVGHYLPGVKAQERRIHRDILRAFCQKMNYTWVLEELDEEEGIAPAPPEDPSSESHPKKPRKK